MRGALASLLAPPRCGLCSAPAPPTDAVCGRCRLAIERLGPVRSAVGGLEVVSAARYEGPARRLVAAVKFSGRLALCELAAEAMLRAWGGPPCAALVPVPAAPARARARGFDAAWTLARLVGRRARLRPRGVLARADGPRQVGRPRAARLGDPPRVHLARGAGVPPGAPVWLVDDVVTTGATVLECARALRAAGAAEVAALSFARA